MQQEQTQESNWRKGEEDEVHHPQPNIPALKQTLREFVDQLKGEDAKSSLIEEIQDQDPGFIEEIKDEKGHILGWRYWYGKSVGNKLVPSEECD